MSLWHNVIFSFDTGTGFGFGDGVGVTIPNGVAVRISDFIPEPISFTALTWNLYVIPFTNPSNVNSKSSVSANTSLAR